MIAPPDPSEADIAAAARREAAATTRSAEHILQRAQRRLDHCGYGVLRAVSCEYQHGILTLRGGVPSYYLKQVAQATLMDLQGVHRVDNQLRVMTD